MSFTFEDILANPGLFGYTVGNEEDGYHAYGPPLEDNDKRHKITTEPVETEAQALRILADYLNKTYAGADLNEA